MKKIAVTGSSGKLGHFVVHDLLEHGCEVTCIDQTASEMLPVSTRMTHLDQLGEVYDVLAGHDAVLHLAAIPGAFIYSNDFTFHNNVQSTYNVFEAAAGLGIKKVVFASSECAYGIGFAKDLHAPDYLPLDEDHPLRPEDCYGLGKLITEEIALAFWRRSQVSSFALRFGFIHLPDEIDAFPQKNQDSQYRLRNLWNYIDVRDAAAACRLSLEASLNGVQPLNIVADDTGMQIESQQLIRETFPQILDIRGDLSGYRALISNQKAKDSLGWQPRPCPFR